MSDCKCQQPCNPCNNNCPDDGEILPVEILDAEDCNTGCCGKKCNDNCGVNIQSTSDCLTVDTSECGVVKLTPTCPPRVVAGDNVTVTSAPSSEEGYSIDYTVNANADDRYVAACDGDKYPGTLEDKIVAGHGVEITTSGCSGRNAHMTISMDDSYFSDENNKVAVTAECKENAGYLADVVNIDSSYIEGNVSGCVLNITDKVPKLNYAKMYMNKDWTKSGIASGSRETYIPESSYWTKDLEQGQCKYTNGMLKTTLHGLYIVGFSGSVEVSYGVHAIRVQLVKMDSQQSTYYTIIESRHSGVIGEQPFNIPAIGGTTYVSSVSGGGGESAPSVSYRTYNMDTPLISQTTESGGQTSYGGHSSSLGAYLDRVPFSGATIVELNPNDSVLLQIKVSAEVSHGGDLLGKVPSTYLSGTVSLLGRDGESDWRIGGECGCSVFMSLLQPLR